MPEGYYDGEWDNEPDEWYPEDDDDWELEPIVCEDCGNHFIDWPEFNTHYCP